MPEIEILERHLGEVSFHAASRVGESQLHLGGVERLKERQSCQCLLGRCEGLCGCDDDRICRAATALLALVLQSPHSLHNQRAC